MMKACKELDLLESFSHASNAHNTVEIGRRFEEVHHLSDFSLSSTIPTSGRRDVEQPVQPSTFGSRDVDQPAAKSTSGRVYRGSSNTGNHAAQPPIRAIRIPNQQISNDELMAASALLMLADQSPWTITKILKDSDKSHQQNRLLIGKSQVDNHIIPRLDEQRIAKITTQNGLNVRVKDVDTNDVLNLTFKWWSSSRSYIFQGGWSTDFVRRRNLNKGDLIGLFWSPIDSMFFFSVLERANYNLI